MAVILINSKKFSEFSGWLLEKYQEADIKEKKYKRSREYWRIRRSLLKEVIAKFQMVSKELK